MTDWVVLKILLFAVALGSFCLGWVGGVLVMWMQIP